MKSALAKEIKLRRARICDSSNRKRKNILVLVDVLLKPTAQELLNFCLRYCKTAQVTPLIELVGEEVCLPLPGNSSI